MNQLRFLRRLVLGMTILLLSAGGAWAIQGNRAESVSAAIPATTLAPSPTSLVAAPAATLAEASPTTASVPESTTSIAATSTSTSTSTTSTSTTSTTTTTTAPPPASTTTPTTSPPTSSTTTTTTTTTTTLGTGGWEQPPTNILSEAAVYDLLIAAGFPAEAATDGVEVIRCETVPDFNASSLHPNGLYAGLFQHALYYWDVRSANAGVAGQSPYDPAANAAVGLLLWNEKQTFSGHWPHCGAGR